MKKLLCCLALGMLFVACHKDGPYKGGDKDLVVPADFSWKTLERQDVTLDQTSSVYLVKSNGDRALVGENLEPGKYAFSVGNGKLEVVEASTEKSVSISRAKDDVPNGHEMAYFPSKDGWAMMMVEDVFPWTGDLDMNDIVFNFRIEYEVNRKNQEDPGVWGMTVRIKPMAMGGNMYKQIGLALNFVGKDIALTNIKVDGQAFMDAKDKNDNSMFTLGKGFEVGEEYVVPLVGNLYKAFKNAPSEGGILNTYTKLQKYDADEIVVTMQFAKEPKLSQVQLVPDADGNMMDFFVTLGTRDREVHLKGHPATNKMDPELLRHSNNRGFASPENWVWALILESSIKYPQEGIAIYKAYPDFVDWVNGRLEADAVWTFNVNHDLVY